jgi:hypothetical protein
MVIFWVLAPGERRIYQAALMKVWDGTLVFARIS